MGSGGGDGVGVSRGERVEGGLIGDQGRFVQLDREPDVRIVGYLGAVGEGSLALAYAGTPKQTPAVAAFFDSIAAAPGSWGAAARIPARILPQRNRPRKHRPSVWAKPIWAKPILSKRSASNGLTFTFTLTIGQHNPQRMRITERRDRVRSGAGLGP